MRPLQRSACILPAQTHLWRNESSLRNPLHGHLHICGSHSLAQCAEETYVMPASRNSSQNQQTEVALESEGTQWLTPAALSQTYKRVRFQSTAFQRHIQDLTKSYSKDRKPFVLDSNRQQRHFQWSQWILPFLYTGQGKAAFLVQQRQLLEGRGLSGVEGAVLPNQQHKHGNSFSISSPACWQSSCPSAKAQGKVSHCRSNWTEVNTGDRFPRKVSLAELLEPDLLPLYYKNILFIKLHLQVISGRLGVGHT